MVNEAAKQLGKLGGKATSRKFTHKHYVKIGKKGGRPKKAKKSGAGE